MIRRLARAALLAALIGVASGFAAAPAAAQNKVCPTMPVGDSTTACASTEFVQSQLGPGATAPNAAALTALINPATAALSGALPAWPSDTTKFFRGDGSYSILPNAASGALFASAGAGVAPTYCTACTVTGLFTVTFNLAHPAPAFPPAFMHLQAEDGAQRAIVLDSFQNGSGANLPPYVLFRAAGGTAATPAPTASGLELGAIVAKGYGTTGYPSGDAGSIGWITCELWSDTTQCTRIIFNVTPLGTATACPGFGINPGITANYVTTTIGCSSAAQSGAIRFSGGTSGLMTMQVAPVAGTYTMEWPTTPGSAGQPLLSAGGGATPMTYGTLGLGAGGTNATTAAGAIANLFTGTLSTAPITVNFAVAGDYAIAVPLPTGFTQIRANAFMISQCSVSLAAATFGVFTDVAAGGATIVSAGATSTITNNTANTNNNAQFYNAVGNPNTEAYTPVNGAVQFRVGSTAAGTCKVSMQYGLYP